MLQTLLTGLSAQPVLFALAGDHTESAYRVILGLAIIAAVEIAAGLWLIHAGDHSRR